MISIPILYNEHMWCDNGHEISPSSKKPKFFTDYVLKLGLPCTIVNPLLPLQKEDFYRVHDRAFVDGIFNCTIKNGFGTTLPEVTKTLPWTSSSMFFACQYATEDVPAISPTSGFHHAGFDFSMGFCTFNGLMVSAMKCLANYPLRYSRIAIIDCDAHVGNGTTNIINHFNLSNTIYHKSFGEKFPCRIDEPVYTLKESIKYNEEFKSVEKDLVDFKPDLIMYQAGADVHVDDSYGGILTTEQMIERDVLMFTIAKKLRIPLAFNLAGGYQVEANGNIDKVLNLHVNTVKAAISVYN